MDNILHLREYKLDKLEYRKGALKMGQHSTCSCGTIEAEAAMPCAKCPNKSTSVIKTPHGYICPDCYKRLYVQEPVKAA